MDQYIIDSGSITSIDFSGASIYLDACFILTFLDIEDRRNDAVANMVDKWKNDGNITIGYSSHTYSEVVQTLFRGLVLGSLQFYHLHKELLNKTRKGYDHLTHEQKNQLISFEAARFLYKVGKDNFDNFGRKHELRANVNEIIKIAKENEGKRHLLDPYYMLATMAFTDFVFLMHSRLGFQMVALDSGEADINFAQINSVLTQLDATDALHLGIARNNGYDYLATLDGDFEHNYYSKVSDMIVKILKVA